MSAWRDRLQPASFRNVPFSVRSADSEIGRRTVLHEYPQRNEPGSEDMGRRTRRFSVEALVVGQDYFTARDKLIEALETAGPGELVHPFYGRRQVVLDGPVRVSESFEEGGLARFSLDFVESGKTAQLIVQADTQSRIESAAVAARTASVASFAERYSIASQPAFVANSALTMAQTAMSKMATLRGMIPDLSSAAAWLATANGVSSELASLIASPGSFASNVQALIGGARSLSDNPITALSSLKDLFGFGKSAAVSYIATSGATDAAPLSAGAAAVASLDTPLTPAREQEAVNAAAMVSLVQQSAAIEACVAAADAEFDTVDDAIAVRQDLVEQIDTLAAVAESDDVYSALSALRVALVQDVASRGARLPRLSSLTLPATTPAIVVAYRIYADATRDSDVLARNPAIQHPGFVPGGVALQVLVDS